MKLECILLTVAFLGIMGCKSDTEGEISEDDVFTLCSCENNVEESREFYAFVVKGDNCCKSKISKDYPASKRTFEQRPGNTWELMQREDLKPRQVQSEACKLNIDIRHTTVTGENRDFVNSVLTFGQDQDIDPDQDQ